MTEPINMSAVDLAAAIRSRTLTPTEVVEAHIARIEAVNPALNAITTPLFDTARQQAAAATAHITTHGTAGLPPLFGVPFTVKEALAVAGVRHTGGYWPLRENIAEEDAAAVRLLREAGGIPIARTNCPDLSMSVETHNPIFGRTNNPHDLTRTPGGSSGGEAALIAAGGSPLGLGSDIAGSLRSPAAYTGIVSLKPTAHRIPTGGHIPPSIGPLDGWSTVGPLARRIADLHLALEVLSTTPVSPLAQVETFGRRVISPRALWFMPPHPEVVMAWEQALKVLKAANLTYDDRTHPPVIRTILHGVTGIYQRGLDAMHAELKTMDAVSDGTMANLNAVELFNRVLPRVGFNGAERKIEALREAFKRAMGPGGVMVYATVPDPAPEHGFAGGLRGSPAYCSWVNVLGFPAVAVPVGTSTHGLPIGVQVIAHPGEDEVALAVAAIIEEAFGGWRMAFNN